MCNLVTQVAFTWRHTTATTCRRVILSSLPPSSLIDAAPSVRPAAAAADTSHLTLSLSLSLSLSATQCSCGDDHNRATTTRRLIPMPWIVVGGCVQSVAAADNDSSDAALTSFLFSASAAEYYRQSMDVVQMTLPRSQGG